MMHKTRLTIIGVAALLLALSGLACSIGGDVDVEGPLVTREAVEEESTALTAPPVEATTPPEAETPPPAEATTPPEAETPQPTQPPAAGTPMPPAPPVEALAGQDPLAFAEIPELEIATLDPTGEGLGHMGTFRQRMTVRFTAQDTGYTGVYHYDAEVNTAEQAVHVTVSGEGAVVQELPANQVQAIWIGDRLWIKVGSQPWLPVPESVAALQFDQQLFAIGNFLPYVRQFQKVGEETVNGIPSVHYTYDSQNLPAQYGAVSGHGDVYVALDGGYVVRYTLDGSGTFEEYFQGSGAISLVYDTYDVGADISIKPPRR